MEKLDYLTKLLVRKGMSLNDAINFKNIFATFMGFVFVLYIAFGNLAIRAIEKSEQKNASVSSDTDELTMEERVGALRQEEAPQQEADPLRSFARKAGIFMIRLMLFVILAATIFLHYEVNILWLWFLLYGPICIILAFYAFDTGTTWRWIMLVIGILMTISGGAMVRPATKRAKLEKQLRSQENAAGRKGSGGSGFIL